MTLHWTQKTFKNEINFYADAAKEKKTHYLRAERIERKTAASSESEGWNLGKPKPGSAQECPASNT